MLATRSPAAWKVLGLPPRRHGHTTTSINLFGYEWELTKSPAGAQQWTPKDEAAKGTVPDAHDPSKIARPDHVHDRPGTEDGPDLWADFKTIP